MCGIVAGISKKENIVPLLLDGLKKLEYRGYDSSGMSILKDGSFNLVKKVGRVNELEKSINEFDENDFNSHVGVAHTRWSTHGVVNELNAHPHNSKHFSIVHNGIIENYKELKAILEDKGYVFNSETDTEIVLHLLQENYKHEESVYKAITESMKVLEGSYALSIIHDSNPNVIWAVKKDSPLVIGSGKDRKLIASDKNAISDFVNEIYYLGDNEIAKIEFDELNFFTIDAKLIYKPSYPVSSKKESTDKNGFDFYMEKEIYEQPSSIRNTLSGRVDGNSIELNEFKGNEHLLNDVENIEIVSCGTSNHAALIAKTWFENLLKIPCHVEIASEYRYNTQIVRPNTLFVTISQSGETADTLAALKKVKENNEHLGTLSVCNVEHSTIDMESDVTMLTKAGVEIGVASTKAFTTQLTSLLMLIWKIGEVQNRMDFKDRVSLLSSIKSLPNLMDLFLSCSKTIDNIVPTFLKSQNALYIGRGEYGALAMEGALKLKEISYIHAEAFFAGELKHGSLALIDEEIPIVAVSPSNDLFNKMYSNVEEILSRKGKVIMFTDLNVKSERLQVVQMPKCDEIIAPICYTIPLQYLAFKVAKDMGNDVDKPRNLAKSVTVE